MATKKPSPCIAAIIANAPAHRREWFVELFEMLAEFTPADLDEWVLACKRDGSDPKVGRFAELAARAVAS